MTKEQIEQAAREYAEKAVPQFQTAESVILTKAYKIGFEAGAEYRQAEIDELTLELGKMVEHANNEFSEGCKSRQAEIDELNEQINSLKATLDIEVNHIQPRMKAEIDELIEALSLMNPFYNEFDKAALWEVHKIKSILKKYEV